MNGIGIIEWSSTGAASSYPLEASELFNLASDVFIDASFVQFDNFIPKLNWIDVQADKLIISITVDNGDKLIEVTSDQCINGYMLTIRDTSRYHGRLIFGEGITSLLDNYKGSKILLDTFFDPNTVRSIPSKSGLYSLEGLTGNVVIKTDDAQFFDITGNDITWNTVARPSKVKQYKLSADKLYASTSTNKFIEIDPLTGSYSTVFDLTQKYTGLVARNDKLLGASGKSIFDLTYNPPQKLLELDKDIKSLSFFNNRFIALSATTIIVLNNNLTGVESEYTLGTIAGNAILGTDSDILFTVNGPFDNNENKKVADILYKAVLTPSFVKTLAGLMKIDGSMYAPGVYGLAYINDKCYAIVNDDISNKLVELDPNLGVCTLSNTFEVDTILGRINNLINGYDTNITIKNFVALKTINGVGSTTTALDLKTGGIVSVQQTGKDTLTLSVGVSLDKTKVKPTAKYE